MPPVNIKCIFRGPKFGRRVNWLDAFGVFSVMPGGW